MRTLFTMLFAFCVGLMTLTAQQIELNGQVSIHNSKYRTGQIEYVEGTAVSAPFAGETSSDSEGEFRLTFQGIANGTVIKLSAEKAGYEVVNSYYLERVVLGQKPRLPIYITTKGRLAQAQTELYNISKTALYARKNAIIARLQSDKSESDAALAELQEDWGVEIRSIGEAMELLDSKIGTLEKRLPEFAQELATKNLDFASELYIEAYKLYQAGDIAGALAVLDDAKLEQSYEEALATLTKSENFIAIGEELQEKAQLQIDQIIGSYSLKANGHKVLFEYSKAISVQRKIIEILKNIDKEETLVLAKAYEELGEVLLANGQFNEALSFFLESYDINENQVNQDIASLARNAGNLATTYRHMALFEEAFYYQENVISLIKKLPDSLSGESINYQNNLALIYTEYGDYEQALQVQLQCLNELNSSDPVDTLLFGTIYNNLGLIYSGLEQYESAMYYYQQAINVEEAYLSVSHPKLANTYSNLAGTYKALGRYAEALELQEKAIKIRKDVLGDSHYELGISYNQIALILNDLGRYQKALEILEKAFHIFEAVYQDDHPHLATVYGNFSTVYINLKEYETANAYQEKALAIDRSIFGPKSLKVAIDYTNLATIRYEMGNLLGASMAQNLSILIKESILGKEHPNLCTAYSNMSNILRGLGETASAISYQRKALYIGEQSAEITPDGLASLYHNSVSLFLDVNQLDSALIYQSKAEFIWKDFLPPNHPTLKLVESNFDILYAKQAEVLMEAEQFHLAVDALKKQLKHTTADSLEIYQKLGSCYFTMREYGEALTVQQKALSMKNQVLEPNHPKIATSYHNLARVFYYQGQLDSAIVYENSAYNIWQEKLVGEHSYLKSARNNLAFFYPKQAAQYRAEGLYQKAIENYENALEFGEESGDIYNSIGLCYYYSANYSLAIENYEKAYQLEGENEALFLNNTGMAYAKSGDMTEAAVRFKQLEELLPDNGLPYRDWGLYYVLKREYDTALGNLEKAFQLDYDNWDWLRTEEALNPLRDHPRFKALLEQAPTKNE